MKIKRHVRYAWGIEYIYGSSDPVLVDEFATPDRYLLCRTRAESRRLCATANDDASVIGIKCIYRPVKVRETIEIIGR